jgi:hypothetical protein
MKTLIAFAAALVAGALVMMLVAWAGTSIWPLHVPADPNNREALIEGLAMAPAGAQITVLLAWFLGTFAAAAIAKKLSGLAWPGWTIAGVLAFLLAFIFFVPLPVWMQTLAPISPLLGAAVADVVVKGRRSDATGKAEA